MKTKKDVDRPEKWNKKMIALALSQVPLRPVRPVRNKRPREESDAAEKGLYPSRNRVSSLFSIGDDLVTR